MNLPALPTIMLRRDHPYQQMVREQRRYEAQVEEWRQEALILEVLMSESP